MGNALSDPYGSALQKGACSGRNITWNYIHNHCLPTTYYPCPHAAKILHSHNCRKGVCHPNSYFDKEFDRYGWDNWDGLGDPFLPEEELKKSSPFSHSREDGPDTFMKGEVCPGPYLVIVNWTAPGIADEDSLQRRDVLVGTELSLESGETAFKTERHPAVKLPPHIMLVHELEDKARKIVQEVSLHDTIIVVLFILLFFGGMNKLLERILAKRRRSFAESVQRGEIC